MLYDIETVNHRLTSYFDVDTYAHFEKIARYLYRVWLRRLRLTYKFPMQYLTNHDYE